MSFYAGKVEIKKKPSTDFIQSNVLLYLLKKTSREDFVSFWTKSKNKQTCKFFYVATTVHGRNKVHSYW